MIKLAAYCEHRGWELGCAVITSHYAPDTWCLILSDYVISCHGETEAGVRLNFSMAVGHCVAFAQRHKVSLPDLVHLLLEHYRKVAA